MTHRIPFGREVFPKKSGERIGDSFLRRCNKCDSVLNTQKTAWSKSGEGSRYNGETGNDADRTHTGGCWFCDSLNWADGKPEKLPDDRLKPSRTWKQRNRRR